MKYVTEIPLKLRTPEGILELKPGEIFKPKCEDAVRPLLESRKVRSLKEVFERKFNELADKLLQQTLTAEDIKAQRPEMYKDIQKAIERMDSSWLKEDLPEFSMAIKDINRLYYKALQEIPEW